MSGIAPEQLSPKEALDNTQRRAQCVARLARKELENRGKGLVSYEIDLAEVSPNDTGRFLYDQKGVLFTVGDARITFGETGGISLNDEQLHANDLDDEGITYLFDTIVKLENMLSAIDRSREAEKNATYAGVKNERTRLLRSLTGAK